MVAVVNGQQQSLNILGLLPELRTQILSYLDGDEPSLNIFIYDKQQRFRLPNLLSQKIIKIRVNAFYRKIEHGYKYEEIVFGFLHTKEFLEHKHRLLKSLSKVFERCPKNNRVILLQAIKDYSLELENMLAQIPQSNKWKTHPAFVLPACYFGFKSKYAAYLKPCVYKEAQDIPCNLMKTLLFLDKVISLDDLDKQKYPEFKRDQVRSQRIGLIRISVYGELICTQKIDPLFTKQDIALIDKLIKSNKWEFIKYYTKNKIKFLK